MTARVYPAEYVFPAHPDKLCDTIADALVEEAARREQRAQVGVEVAVNCNNVYVTGRIACREAESIDVAGVARKVFASVGYDDEWYPGPNQLKVHTDLRLEPLADGEAEFRRMSDDQSIVSGYAVDLPGTNYLPPEHWLAWRISRRLAVLRSALPELRLGPDGKVIVLYEEMDGESRLVGLSTSLQQQISGDCIDLHRTVLDAVKSELEHAAQAIPGFRPCVPEDLNVNGAGNFAEGGPVVDNGLSGKKLVVDAYGPRVPIGGGALSGKDFYKADRAGAILARRLAKAVVLTGTARESTATVAFFPGDERARVTRLIGDSVSAIETTPWEKLLDLSLAGVGDRYGCLEDLTEVARWGHFLNGDLGWERMGFDNSTASTTPHPNLSPARSGAPISSYPSNATFSPHDINERKDPTYV